MVSFRPALPLQSHSTASIEVQQACALRFYGIQQGLPHLLHSLLWQYPFLHNYVHCCVSLHQQRLKRGICLPGCEELQSIWLTSKDCMISCI